ncbi:MAG: LamG domain-containing protein, partial [Patescibacteria group bacterium]
FEGGDTSKWGDNDTGNVNSGNIVEIVPGTAADPDAAGKILHTKTTGGATNANAFLRKNIVATDEMYARFKFNLNANVPQANHFNISSMSYGPTSATANIVSLGIRRTSGDPNNSFYVSLAGSWNPTPLDLNITQWYCMEYHVKRNTGLANDLVEVWVDGNLEYTTTTAELGVNQISWLRLGAQGGSAAGVPGVDYFYDDYGAHAERRIACSEPLPEPDDPNLLGHWQFEKIIPAGSEKMVIDSTANQRHAALYGIGDDNWIADNFGSNPGAVRFHHEAGHQERMEVTLPNITGTHARSFTAWVKAEKLPGKIFSQGTLPDEYGADGQDALGQDFSFRVENISGTNYLVFYSGGGATIHYTFPGSVVVNAGPVSSRWFHLAVVVPANDAVVNGGDGDGFIESTEVKVYINATERKGLNKLCSGSPCTIGTGAVLNTALNKFLVGGYGGLSPDPLSGRVIDEVRAYDRALTAEDIQNIKESGGYRPFGVLWHKGTGELQGWGWGGIGIGWISFSHVEWCDTNRDNVSDGSPERGCPVVGTSINFDNARVIFNEEPKVRNPVNFTFPAGAMACGFVSPPVQLHWNVEETDFGDKPDAYQVVVQQGAFTNLFTTPDQNSCTEGVNSNNPSKAGPVDDAQAYGTCDSAILMSCDANFNPATGEFENCIHDLLNLSYNTTYYWSVRVKDNPGLLSQWSNWWKQSDPESFTTPPLPPVLDFSYTPANPTQNEVVHFKDKSDCGGGPGSCTSPPYDYEWDFKYDGSYGATEIDCTATECNYTYSAPVSGNRVYLRVTDPLLGEFCEKEKSLDIYIPFPGWKEISPF